MSNLTIESINARIENLRTTRQFCGDSTVRATITRRMSTLENERRDVLAAVVAKHAALRKPVSAKVISAPKVEAPKVEAPKVTTIEREHEQDRDDVMALKDSTSGQMRRINRAYKVKGLREFTSLNAFRKVFPTMLDASMEYRSTKA